MTLAAAFRLSAQVRLAAGEPAQALEHATHAFEHSRAVARDAARSADAGEALLWQARAFEALGRRDDAMAAARAAAIALAVGLAVDHRLTRAALEIASR